MRRALSLGLLGAWGLSACQPVMLAPSAGPEPSSVEARRTVPQAPNSPSIEPTPAPSPTPRAEATPTPAPTATPGPVVRLTGTVKVDAHYLLQAGIGRLVSNNGGTAIALAGGSIISGNGGSLISNNGGGLISDKGTGFRLLAESALAVGTLLPVQGMAVLPYSMASGKPLGAPVLTDAAGAYQVEVPESTQGNVLLIARVPAERADAPVLKDARLQYAMVAPPKAASGQVIDEETALVTKYYRISMVGRLQPVLATSDFEASAALIRQIFDAPPAMQALLIEGLRGLHAAAQASGFAALPREKQERVLERVADVLQAQLDSEAITLDKLYYNSWTGGAEKAVPAMMGALRAVREGAATRMREDAAFFEQQAYLAAANANKPEAERYRILKPSDLAEFMVREYTTRNYAEMTSDISAVMRSIGAETDATGVSNTARMLAGGNAVMMAAIQVLLADKNGAKRQAIEAIETYRP